MENVPNNSIINLNTFFGLINTTNIISTQEGKSDTLLFCTLFFIVWFFLPVLSVVIFLPLLYRFHFNRKVETFLFLLIALSFGLVGYTTQSVGVRDTDITRYFFTYSWLSQVSSFNDFVISFVVDGGNNLIFYVITFLMTRIFPDNPQVMPFFWVTLTYFVSFLTIRECVTYFTGLSREKYVLIIFASIVGIITFFTVTEILKQVSSVAIFAYALIKKMKGQKGALLILIISILIHFSSLLLLPVYFLCRKEKIIGYMPVVFFVCLVLSFFNFNVLMYDIISLVFNQGVLVERLKFYEDVETWTISLRFYAVFVTYFLLIVLFYYDYYNTDNSFEKRQKRHFLIVHSIAFFILLINRSNVHNFIRYTLGYFPFYIIAVIQLFTIRIVKFEKIILMALIFAFYFYSNIKMLADQTVVGADYANSYMNNDLPKIITSNVVGFFRFRINNGIGQ